MQMIEEYEIGHAANSLCAFAQDLRLVKMSMNKESKETKIFVHRDGPDWEDVSQRTSDIRNGNDKEETVREPPVKNEISEELAIPLVTRYSLSDVIFANGNNRDKRRAEVFEYYSELHKYKEHRRDPLYHNAKVGLTRRIALLTSPRLLLAENGGNAEEQDLCEERDMELTRLRHWRRYQRNENVKLYYKDSSRVYKEAVNAVDKRLEKLKQFFQKQRQQLAAQDKELSDISSSRSEKLYVDCELTSNEFELITSEQTTQPQRNQPRGQQRESESDSDRRREHRDGHLNRIMKRYTPPDELSGDAVEQDLGVLRSLCTT